MSMHTPGPWIYEADVGTHVIRGAEKDHHDEGITYKWRGYVATTWGGGNEADARLIAAAPEMFDALVSAVKDAEQAECEIWLANEWPSADAERLHSQWRESSEYRSFCEHWQAQIDSIAKAKGDPA